MADTLKQRIIELLSKDTTEFYSISDIAKKLDSAYSHAHTFVGELAREEVILIKKIGNVSVCSLNLKSGLACSYLSLLESRKAKEWKDKNPHAAKTIEKIDIVKDSIHAALVKNNNIILIVPEKISNADFSMLRNRTVITFAQFMKNRQHYKDAIVIYGAEKYWSMLA
jgi:hypothetical protein